MITLLKLSRPLHLLLAALTYVFGASIAKYLGKPFEQVPFWLGLAGILLAQVSMNLLAEVYRPANEPITENETLVERKSVRDSALYISIASLAALAVIAFVLYLNNRLAFPPLLFLALSLLLVITYSIPPVRLLNRGLGEFTLAAHLGYVIPSIGFLFQSNEYHRLLPSLAIPLTALAFAYFLILNFPAFASDQKYQRRTMLRLLSWERAVPFHHSLIVAAYVLFFAASSLGFSLNLIWPAFLTLPFAVFQIVQLRAIALGNRPNWPLLTSTALAVFGLTAYFLTLTFWLR
ncbi:MAG: prenyltransferase [Chloroflexi bacterium]|nr:prenyltransferase [Chloroflexota bacterium]